MAFELRQDRDGGYRLFEKKEGCGCGSIIGAIIVLAIFGSMCGDGNHSTSGSSHRQEQVKNNNTSNTVDNQYEQREIENTPPTETENDNEIDVPANEDNIISSQDYAEETIKSNNSRTVENEDDILEVDNNEIFPKDITSKSIAHFDSRECEIMRGKIGNQEEISVALLPYPASYEEGDEVGLLLCDNNVFYLVVKKCHATIDANFILTLKVISDDNTIIGMLKGEIDQNIVHYRGTFTNKLNGLVTHFET